MSSAYPHKLKEFVLKEFQKHLDEEPPIDGEKLTIKNYFHFFHKKMLRNNLINF